MCITVTLALENVEVSEHGQILNLLPCLPSFLPSVIDRRSLSMERERERENFYTLGHLRHNLTKVLIGVCKGHVSQLGETPADRACLLACLLACFLPFSFPLLFVARSIRHEREKE